MQIQRRLFITFLMIFLPGMVLQAGALDAASAAKPQILRQESVTKGYQPLPVGKQSIAAAYLSQTLGTPRGAVLLLHDINEHIDSAAIGVLRRQLPEHGWNTLSIKIIRFTETNEQDLPATETEDAATTDNETPPEADDTAEPPEMDAAEATEPPEETYTAITTSQRLDAALLKLQQEGHENIVLIGQGAGGELALNTLKKTAVPVAGLIMINTGELANGKNITDTDIPILEILGSRQQESVKQAVFKRQIQMKTQRKNNYYLRQINGANHYFSNVPLQLTNQVHGWLYKQFFDEEASR